MKKTLKTLLVLTMALIFTLGGTTGVFAKEGSLIQGLGQGQITGQGQMPTELREQMKVLRDMTAQNKELYQQVLTKRNQYRETFQENVHVIRQAYQEQMDEFNALREETKAKMQAISEEYKEAVAAGADEETLNSIIEEATAEKTLIREYQEQWNELKNQIQNDIEKCKPYEDEIMGYMDGIKARIENEKTLAAQLKERIREENYAEATQIAEQIRQLKIDNNSDLLTVLDLLSE